FFFQFSTISYVLLLNSHFVAISLFLVPDRRLILLLLTAGIGVELLVKLRIKRIIANVYFPNDIFVALFYRCEFKFNAFFNFGVVVGDDRFVLYIFFARDFTPLIDVHPVP